MKEFHPIHIDYFAREAVMLLNQFKGVETGQSCSGHLQEGSSNKDDVIIHYTPGFKHHGFDCRWDKIKKIIANIPEKYEIDGKQITLDDLKRSTYTRPDMLLISPLEDVYIHDHKNLAWTSFHLLFGEFKPEDTKTKELENRLNKVYRQYEEPLGLKFRGGKGCYGPDKPLNEQNNVKTLVAFQQLNYDFWREIENQCRNILNN